MKNSYPSYEEAKSIVQKVGFQNSIEYKRNYKKYGLPSEPSCVYKDSGWENWQVFLNKDSYPPYEEVKKKVIANRIESVKQYLLLYKQLGLPSNPSRYYKNKGWINWNDFLGKDKPQIVSSYEEAKRILQENGIKTFDEYALKHKELALPSSPKQYYKGKGWKNWTDYFNRPSRLVLPDYETAKHIVLDNKVKSQKEYYSCYKKLGLPSCPQRQYKNKGWTDWYDFLGIKKPISSSARKTKVYTTLSISPVLLEDNAPLQIVYMLASQIDKKLASEIEELLNTASCEDRLNMVKEQLKSLKTDTEPMSVSPRESAIGELSAMESMMAVFEDTLGSLSEDTTEYLNNIIKNYYHNATNRALIAEYDD